MDNNLRESGWIDDWYVVDGAPFGQPEGTAKEWHDLVEWLKCGPVGYHQTGRRLGAERRSDGLVKFYSPRNSIGDHDCVVILPGEVESWLRVAAALLLSEGGGI